MRKKGYSSLKNQMICLILFSSAFLVLLGSGYYFFASRLMQQKEKNYVGSLMKQVVENIEDASSEMVRYANTVSNDGTVQKYLHSDVVLDKLAYSRTISNSIMNLTVDSQRGTTISILDNHGSSLPRRNYSVIDYLEEHYDIYSLKNNDHGFTGKIYNSFDGLDYYVYFQTISDTQAGAKLNSKIGVCIVMNTVAKLEKSIGNISTTPNAVVMVLDGGFDIIASNSHEQDLNALVSQAARQMKAEKAASESTRSILGGEYIVQYQEIPETGWQIVSAVPLAEINSDLKPLVYFGVLLMVAAIAVFTWWGIHVFRSIAVPILEISDFMHKDAYASLRTRLDIKERNEIGLLAGHINELLDRISEMTNVILKNQSNMYEMDLAKKRAELSALQSQINPHFLYNTLDCVKGYGYLLQSREIVEIIDALSSMMRYCIKGADIVPLKAELDMVGCYLKIMSIRFEDRFSLSVDIPEALNAVLLPRLTLQPIVENAASHGLEPKPGKGRLTIRGFPAENGDICLTVADDGVGIQPETLSRLKTCLESSSTESSLHTPDGEGLALFNVHNRIRGLYGGGYGLQIESVPGEGTSVCIRIPGSSGQQELQKS